DAKAKAEADAKAKAEAKPKEKTGAQKRADIIAYAKQFLGTRYVWGGSTPKGFDCSGLVQYSHRNAAGINLPRVSHQQGRAGTVVSAKDALPGDIVYYPRGHVGIYLGNGKLIHAAGTRYGVIIGGVNDFGYHKFVRVT
ncbi:MAG: C40 family peptidase, partial [Actinomycetaceae bacterium]|nr:C40 family peptidase [Actinomycetaceae bacterium]